MLKRNKLRMGIGWRVPFSGGQVLDYHDMNV